MKKIDIYSKVYTDAHTLAFNSCEARAEINYFCYFLIY